MRKVCFVDNIINHTRLEEIYDVISVALADLCMHNTIPRRNMQGEGNVKREPGIKENVKQRRCADDYARARDGGCGMIEREGRRE